ncbi:hypothetical protein FZ041_01090 [Selenomonas caprae]|uniref:Uncharacterized protein n=1 Tax=Selenomonas caprae TaxID=2606905 RepID=A0A5D6WTX1_9FIRM|nr:hypothetical protein [Selenomonas caprae]TYZ30702.1 hypothetical protein FZ041_01090 [Selenomonas caprae]
MILYILGFTALFLLFLLYRYLPSKKIFCYFCLTLLAAGGIVYFLWPAKEPAPAAISAEDLNYQLEQQQIFAAWYAGYQRDISELDRNWQWYHQILESFKEDSISIQTTYVRLKQLDQDSLQLRDRISHNAPPVTLNDGCYDLLIEVMKKTTSYADAQYRTIALTKAAADPANLRSNDQTEQSRMLQSIMIRESPAGLYTAKEIATIRDYLDVQEDTSPAQKQ